MKDLGIKSFNRQNVKNVRSAIDEAIAILKEAGLNASIGNITFNDGEVRTKLTVTPKYKGKRVAKVLPFGANDDLNNSDLFSKFKDSKLRLNNKVFTLVGFKARNFKMPFIIEGARGGSYKITRDQLLKSLEK